MRRRRVKITGIGPVTPAGIGLQDFAVGILTEESRAAGIFRFREDAGAFIGAEVSDFSINRYTRDPVSRRTPRHTQFALAAAQLALADAKIDASSLGHSKLILNIGAALMDFGTINKSVDLILRKGPVNGLPTSITSASVGSIACQISECLHLKNVSTMAFQSTCCSGLDAIGHGVYAIQNGEADIAICGGTEAPLFFHPMLELKMAGLSPANPFSPRAQCRPFDLWRTTGVIGEGACMLVLERDCSPRPAYAYIDGYASASDSAGELCSGLQKAINGCLENASILPREVEAISAWGPGHQEIDRLEAQVLSKVFGKDLSAIPAYSIKGCIGNPLGAAGAIQTGAVACCIRDEILPPTVNWEYRDPDCNLSLSNQIRRISYQNCLVNSHGLSGSNACLLISQ